MKAIVGHPRFTASAIAGVLALLAWVQLRSGPSAAPAPVSELLLWLFGYSPEIASRLMIGAEIAAAAALLLLGQRSFAIVASGCMAFIALACVSRALSKGGLLWPTATLAGAVALLVLALRSRKREAGAGEVGARRGLSAAWSALATIAVATVSGHLVAAATAPRSTAADEHANSPAGPISIDLTMEGFVGRRLEDTPIGSALPSLRGVVAQESALIVFYNPHCSACHSLFEQFFAAPRAEIVVAVEVPAGQDAEMADSGEEHGDIACVGCERMSLPVGPNWIVASPMVVKVERGVVTCASDRFGGDCLTVE